MKVSIVIPNYNSGEMLINNLPGILETGADEVIIVDDASTDGSYEKLKNNFNVKILKNDRNLGFASTVNRGVNEASGDIVVLLNTDVEPDKNFLGSLLAHFDDPLVFAVGCMDKSLEDGKVVLRGRGIAKWERGFLIHSRGEVDKSDTFWVSLGSGAFKKNIWQKLGGLDEIYNPFYWEDIDLSFRATKHGFKIYFEPKSQVTHKHEEGIIKQTFSPKEIETIAYRNQFLFSWKNMDSPGKWFSHFCWLPYHFGKALLRGNFTFFLGFIWAISKIFLLF